MRQETGANSFAAYEKSVSIQLPLGGHSFSVETIPADARPLFEVITPRTTLVPLDVFDAGACEAFLSAAGLTCRSGETAVTCGMTDGAVAVAAIDAECLQSLRGRFGDKLTLLCPLCRQTDMDSDTVTLFRAGDILYIKVYGNGKLRFAEAVEAAGDAAIVELLQNIEQQLGFGRYMFLCSGDGAKAMRKLLKRFYRNVKCE